MQYLLDIHHSKARKLVATGAPIYVLVNPVEYHGPHLSLHNDHLISLGLTRAVSERITHDHPEWPVLVTQDLELAFAPTEGPGTRPFPYEMVRDVIVGTCESLLELGARRVVFMTFHGNPLHAAAIEEGEQYLRAHGAEAINPFNEAIHELVDADGQRYADAYEHIPEPIRNEMMRDMRLDFHGGFFETSMSLHFAPDSVAEDLSQLPPCPSFAPDPKLMAGSTAARLAGQTQLAKEFDFLAWASAWTAMRPHPGYTGRPAYATREAGKVFGDQFVDRYHRSILALFDRGQQALGPSIPWLKRITLSGRLGFAQE